MDLAILKHGQVTRTTPELAPPLLTTTRTGGCLSSRQEKKVSEDKCPGRYLIWHLILQTSTLRQKETFVSHPLECASSHLRVGSLVQLDIQPVPDCHMKQS
ncbi:hypothetical protein TNCV_1076691 [Trichonephila clavipes]|uniref:Uncharacterized protein n=1 Tax=Trichonephila clavipes TaxID=2585209 RepID=A0A8X6RLW8_TRICX|nr:hypothetical protein TNCV_1076691 [Trichonephila clavipes]